MQEAYLNGKTPSRQWNARPSVTEMTIIALSMATLSVSQGLPQRLET
jgi:hypothetical protein